MLNNFLENITASKSKTFLAFCFCFLFGIALASFLISDQFDFVFFYFGIIIFIPLLILFWEDFKARLIIFSLFFIFLGFSHYAYVFPDQNNISKLSGEEVSFTGTIVREPDVRMDKAQYTIEAKKLEGGREVEGKTLVKTLLYPRYSYGDKLKIKCQLEKPEPFNGFRYDRYLANFDIFTLCRYAQIEKVGEGGGNIVFGAVLDIKRSVARQVNKLWHEPFASFMAGLLYGYRGGLGELDELFRQTGVTHIVAISGFNITIIATILITICINLYIPRQKAFWVITAGIILFLIFAGLSASVVRAGIMGILALLAKRMGRNSSIFNVMILTAVLMAIENPFILIWNAGFQLSFLATIGLVYLAPYFDQFFDFVPDVVGLRESIVSTLSAIILTLPLILYQFGNLSIVAPIVNMMVLGIIPFVMFAGFASVIVSFIHMPAAQVVSWVGRLGLGYITKVVRWFAEFSFASVKLPIPWWAMFLAYFVLLSWLYIQNNQILKANE